MKVNGDIALNVSDLSAAAGTKIFIAQVDNIVGTLKSPRTVVANGHSYTSFKFEYTDGKLYLVRNSTMLRFE